MNTVAVAVALACLLSPASAGSSSCDLGQFWVNIPGTLTQVSSGDAGVWGVNSASQIYYRVGSYVGSSYYSYDGRNYGFSHADGTSWVQVTGALTQIDVGKDSVWGTNSGGNVYYRTGITSVNPTGTEWVYVPGLSASQVSVSDIDGKVWAVATTTGYVYRRVGISDELPGGTSWEYVPGILATSISVGAAGVWATTSNQIYYRTGSRRDCQGSGWQLVDGTLSQIASGGDVVWGVQSSGAIYIRLGITTAAPTGTDWVQVPGGLQQISVASTNNAVWGVVGGDIHPSSMS